jgi:hypothetical protein
MAPERIVSPTLKQCGQIFSAHVQVPSLKRSLTSAALLLMASCGQMISAEGLLGLARPVAEGADQVQTADPSWPLSRGIDPDKPSAP